MVSLGDVLAWDELYTVKLTAMRPEQNTLKSSHRRSIIHACSFATPNSFGMSWHHVCQQWLDFRIVFNIS